MPKDIPAAVITQMDAQQARPVLLFELGLASTVRYAANKESIVFPTAGNTYTAKAIQIGSIGSSLEGQVQKISVKFDNVMGDMAESAHNESYRGKSLIIKRVYLDALGDSSYYNEIFNGLMGRPTEISERWMTVPATGGKKLNKKFLVTPYQKLCPWTFGETECNTDGFADLTTLKATGTADSGTTLTLVDNALTQADDYWNYGRIEIVKSGVTYYRTVENFTASSDTVTWEVQLPFNVDNSCTYTIYKGCEKTWECCSNTYTFGPSADNKANFGGCIHVGQDTDIKRYVYI